ncbi:hypothetical protein EDB80DRAFT_50541 [Ilyonectria destructans]|nr:hypothetical protein EDB80DRAFT_50541 [Ilyonectria destructans]
MPKKNGRGGGRSEAQDGAPLRMLLIMLLLLMLMRLAAAGFGWRPGVGCTSFKGAKATAKVPLPAAWAMPSGPENGETSRGTRPSRSGLLAIVLGPENRLEREGTFLFCLKRLRNL